MRRSAPAVSAFLLATNMATYAFERSAIEVGGDPCAVYGLVPARLIQSHEVGTVVTYMFFHDPQGWLHLCGNLVFLAVFGSVVERTLGSFRFALLYLTAGIGAAAMHVIVDPTSTTPMVGASGAIFGVLAAAAMLYPRTVAFVATDVAFNIACLLAGSSGTIAVGAHIGGFVAGFVLMGTLFVGTLSKVRGWRVVNRQGMGLARA